jgi:hypothetical protein
MSATTTPTAADGSVVPSRPDHPQDGQKTADPRLALIKKFQAEALQRPDPLAANLAVINADLMLVVYALRPPLEKSATRSDPSPEQQQQLARQATTYLAFVRQIDRLAQIDQRLLQAAEPPGGAG